jgi:hypothetical protein
VGGETLQEITTPFLEPVKELGLLTSIDLQETARPAKTNDLKETNDVA